jgi:uncharacterized protein
MEIIREKPLTAIDERLKQFQIVAILGPRQCGKTTLAKQFLSRQSEQKIQFLDCEDPRDLAKLENPMFILEPFEGLIIIDEIQRRPELFPVLRVLADDGRPRKFIILGSASRDLISQSSETLAGRISYLELGGFQLNEIAVTEIDNLWFRGGFPLSFLAATDIASARWREDFIRTFLERDIPQLGIQIPAITLRRFWAMLAHYHGQVFNASEIGRSLNLADTTIKRYLDLLTGTFMVRQLQPWFYNTQKRLVKRPKIYFRDSGILHSLISITEPKDLFNHPRLGASWEGFAIEQIIQELNLKEEDVYFWKIHSGVELDLVFQKRGALWGVEVKFNESPQITSSMRAALQELKLKHLWLVYTGKENYQLDHQITAVGLHSLTGAIRFDI